MSLLLEGEANLLRSEPCCVRPGGYFHFPWFQTGGMQPEPKNQLLWLRTNKRVRTRATVLPEVPGLPEVSTTPAPTWHLRRLQRPAVEHQDQLGPTETNRDSPKTTRTNKDPPGPPGPTRLFSSGSVRIFTGGLSLVPLAPFPPTHTHLLHTQTHTCFTHSPRSTTPKAASLLRAGTGTRCVDACMNRALRKSFRAVLKQPQTGRHTQVRRVCVHTRVCGCV